MPRKNVWVQAPAAELFVTARSATQLEIEQALEPPSAQEIIAMQQIENRLLRSELEKLRITANTIANTCATLSYIVQQDRLENEWVTVPKDVTERMRDVKLSVRSTEEGTQVRWVTRAPDHTFEGRADG